MQVEHISMALLDIEIIEIYEMIIHMSLIYIYIYNIYYSTNPPPTLPICLRSNLLYPPRVSLLTPNFLEI